MIAAGIVSSLAAAAAITVGQAEQPILLDNLCGEAEWTDAAKTEIAPGVTLLAKADENFVYLCWTLPPESLGELDLYLIVPGEASRNLHVSAQVGERWLGPQGWSDYAWDEHAGWYGAPMRATGFEELPDGRRAIAFADSPAREIQIDRDISRAAWWLMFQLHGVGPGRGREITWPQGGVPEDTRTWVELDLSE